MVTVLEAQKRTHGPRSVLREQREKGLFPAVIYGYQVESTPVFVSSKDFTKTMREVGRNGVISLNLGGKKQNVILNDYQEDPLKSEIIHADFLAVNMSQEIEAEVRVELSESCAGVKSGGVLQQPLYDLKVSAKPDRIPEVIQINIENLEIGDNVTVGDIRGDYDCTINHADDETIATILPPRSEVVTTEGGDDVEMGDGEVEAEQPGGKEE